MKKLVAAFMAVCLLLCMAAPVQAIEIPKIEVQIQIPDDFWDKWFEEHPFNIPEIQPTIELKATKITEAQYVHKVQYYGQQKHLVIRWNAVENAKKYEVQITKADGTTIKYTTDKTYIYDKAAQCPKTYIDKSSTWTNATVKVRAVNGISFGKWSASVKIGCDKLHNM